MTDDEKAADEKVVPKRDQVLELLKEGTYTREEMAAKLGMTVASVNSQFTYLRWMKNFIKYDENKKLSLCTEEEHDAWEASKKAAVKVSTAKPKTPAEAYASAKKSLDADIKNQKAWAIKFNEANTALEANPEDENLQDNSAEAAAMVTLLSIKVKRGQAKFATLPVPEPEATVTPEDITVPADEEGDEVSADDDII